MADLDRALSEEAIRLFRRYQVEIVEAFELCPWASVAREQGRVRERVVTAPALSVEPALEAVAALARDESVEIGIVLFPRIEVGRPEFERFVAQVRERDTERNLPEPSPFAMAEFHPEAAAVLTPAGAFTSFVRRTPDPTIQLVRQSALARVRRGERQHGSNYFDPAMIERLYEQLERGTPQPEPELPLHERVLEQNRVRVQQEGLARIAERFAALRRERDERYALLLGAEAGGR